MTLAIILLALYIGSILLAIFGSDDWDRGLNTLAAFLLGGFLLFITLVTTNAVGYENTKKVTTTTHTHSIVSLNDGTGIAGSVRGGLFVIRGQINDTQHFSYYVRNEDGSFKLEKRAAEQSTIHTDATPEAARIDVTDKITSCTAKWWLLCDESQKTVEFSHADFHVPQDSLVNDFSLDAQ